MRLKKAFSIISAVNIFALLIVYQQTEITKYGYRNKQKEDFLQQLADKRNYLKYELEYSKSLRNINDRLFVKEANFNLPHEKQVVLIQMPSQVKAATSLVKAANKEQTLFSKVFFWLTPTAEAQAEGGE
jgi:hypothetical protein